MPTGSERFTDVHPEARRLQVYFCSVNRSWGLCSGLDSGRSALSQEGKTFTGEELMRDGIVPNCGKAMEACVIDLSP